MVASYSFSILSVPTGCDLYICESTSGSTYTKVKLPYTTNSGYIKYRIMKNGVNITNRCVPDETTGRSIYLEKEVSGDNQWYYTYISDAGYDVNFVLSDEYSSNSLPVGDLTYNGVQSITYNGTDYKKFIIDGVKYPLKSFFVTIYGDSGGYEVKFSDGMTWKEFIDSDFNPKGSEGSWKWFSAAGGKVHFSTSDAEEVIAKASDPKTPVKDTDLIEDVQYVKYKTYTIYGYSRDLTNSNPATCITYIDENTSFSAAKMGSSTFDYGSWENAWFMPKPCMLKFDGTVESYLNPNDYTKTTTGDASNVADSYTANAMMEWPIIWVYREYSSDGNTYKFHVSDSQVNSNYKCLANINANGDIVPFYTSIYNAFYGDIGMKSGYRSLSGRAPSVSNTAANEVTYATANGSGWYTDVLVDRLLINDLLVLIGKSTNTQTTFGMGYSSVSSAQSSGFGNTKGLFWGNTSSGSYGVKVFGMENWWGNVWRRTAGYINASGTQKIKLTYGTQDGSTTTGYNTTGSGYITLSNSTPTAGYINSWVKSEYGLIPKTGSGSDSTYDCDYMYVNNNQTDYALFGGSWDYGSLCGAFAVGLNSAPSSTNSAYGVALSYK